MKSLPEGTKLIFPIIATSVKERDFSDAWNFLEHHFANGSSQIIGIGFINPTVQWHILTHSESTLILWICIDLLTLFYTSVIYFRTKKFPFMKEFVEVHHPIL